MNEIAVGLTGIGALFLPMAYRTPVALAMLLVGFFGTWVLSALKSAGGVLLTEGYAAVSGYSLIVVPMFILWGNVASATGFSRGLYDASFAWLGRLRGGLASASVIGFAAFSEVSGHRLPRP